MPTRESLKKLGMRRKLRGAKLQEWIEHNMHEDPMPLNQAPDEPKQKPVMRPKTKTKAKPKAKADA